MPPADAFLGPVTADQRGKMKFGLGLSVQHSPDDSQAGRFLVGDPARVREEIARYRDTLGVTAIIVRLQWPGMAQAQVLRTIRLLGEQVFPHLR
jgi:alkanesulfonate monooxygenase SsuD/methylene tetrahydromethanopterin reductase-like flavin-dependent oxidoreductase (luciferase family)